MKPATIFVAMSGGVDSSVAAALLKDAGFNPRSEYRDNALRMLCGTDSSESMTPIFAGVFSKIGTNREFASINPAVLRPPWGWHDYC